MTNEAAFFTGRSKYFCAGSKSASGFSFFGRRFVQGFGRTSFGQKRADLHQDAACPIRSGAILADTPKGFMRRIFDKFRRAGRYKLLAEVGILRKFRKVCAPHDIELHISPIVSRTFAGVDEPGFFRRPALLSGIGCQALCSAWRFGRPNSGAIGRVQGLLRLIKVLDGRPILTIQVERRG